MNFSISNLAAGFLYGTMGVYFIKRAKRLSHIPSLVIGAALLIYPYLLENEYLVWGIGAALVAVGVKLRNTY